MQVLGKLSGLRELDQNEEVVDAVGYARSLVISFHYEQVEAEPGTAQSGNHNSQEQTLLAVRFAQEGTDELLQALQLPRWRSGRPPLEVWVLIDDGLARRVMPLEYEYLRNPLDQVSWERALPLDWPRPDEEGNYGVDVQLLWGGYTDELENEGQGRKCFDFRSPQGRTGVEFAPNTELRR